jgi:hypothetical protein
MPTPRSPDVKQWYNYYQQFDTGSLGGTPIYGRAVTGAWNTEIYPSNFAADPNVAGIPASEAASEAHVLMPKLNRVCQEITSEIEALHGSKDSYSDAS